MWKFVLPPVILVAVLWVLMSSATTMYVEWLEQGHQRVLAENFSSVVAADQLHHAATLIKNMWPEQDASPQHFQRFWLPARADLENGEAALRETVLTAVEKDKILELRQAIDELLDKGDSQQQASPSIVVNSLLSRIDSLALQLKEINEAYIAAASEHRKNIGHTVFVVRISLLLVGPIVGVWMGWFLSKRLQISVAQISVTLRQADSVDSSEIGTVTLDAKGTLGGIQQRAEQVVNRLRALLQELSVARAEIIRAERLAAVGELAAGVAHEIRNPLTSVKLLLQQAARRPADGTLSGANLDLILDEIGRMEATIQGLLDFSRPTDLRCVRHSLSNTVNRAMNLVQGRASQSRITMHCQLPAETLMVDGDPELLHQVFVNLLINAIEAMPKGGEVAVSVSDGGIPGLVEIEVRDTGLGIPDGLISRLFEPFATTKDRGTGLGLAISRRIVSQHGGTLRGGNNGGPGAVFVVSLPVIACDESPTNRLPEILTKV